MCLILFSFQVQPQWPLVIAANRDEFYQRPTRPAQFWPEVPQLLAGKDLQAGGSWMGVTTDGRFAAVTNYRDPNQEPHYPRSRGALVADFLSGDLAPEPYLSNIDPFHNEYAGFNLLLGNSEQLFFYSNQSRTVEQLSPGTYGLSNGHLDEPWPKVADGKQQLNRIVQSNPDTPKLFTLLADRTLAEDHSLPNTGIDVSMESILSAKFIFTESYGTRASTAITFNNKQQLFFSEQTYDHSGQPGNTAHFDLDIT